MKKHLPKIIISAIILAAVAYMVAQQSKTSAVITVQETFTALQQDPTVYLLDVRTPQEHATERINNTAFIPLQELETRINELEPFKTHKIIVYCRSGHRSGIATDFLRQKGFDAVSMQGGINQWKVTGYTTLKGNAE